MDQIEWLEKWYQKTCNGHREHFYGIEIGTLDNPIFTPTYILCISIITVANFGLLMLL